MQIRRNFSRIRVDCRWHSTCDYSGYSCFWRQHQKCYGVSFLLSYPCFYSLANGITVGDFGTYLDLTGAGDITAAILAANVTGKPTIRFFNSDAANINGLTAAQVLAISGGAPLLTLKSRGAGLSFNPAPPAGGSITVSGTTYQYRDSGGTIIASVKLS